MCGCGLDYAGSLRWSRDLRTADCRKRKMRPSGRARPSATAYVLLLALRLGEEGKGENFLESLYPDFGESTFYEVG